MMVASQAARLNRDSGNRVGTRELNRLFSPAELVVHIRQFRVANRSPARADGPLSVDHGERAYRIGPRARTRCRFRADSPG